MPSVPLRGGEAPEEDDSERRHCIERGKQLDESHLWELATRYYQHRGTSAFSSDVPMIISSNAAIAERYADAVLAFIMDAVQEKPGVPIAIVEMGGGSGRFSYLFLRRFVPMWNASGRDEKLIYIFTDLATTSLQEVSENHSLSSFKKSGLLRFSQMDGNNPFESICCFANGEVLISGSEIICVIANYVFDSLRTDYLRFDSSGDIESPISNLFVPIDANDEDEDLISRVSFSWDWRKLKAIPDVPPCEIAPPLMSPKLSDTGALLAVHGENRTQWKNFNPGDGVIKINQVEVVKTKEEEVLHDWPSWLIEFPDLLPVLQLYRTFSMKNKYDLTITVPIGGLRVLKWIQGHEKVFIIIGDKGYVEWEDMLGRRSPHICIHGAPSFMVNFHLLKHFIFKEGYEYFESCSRDAFNVLGAFRKNDKASIGFLTQCVNFIDRPIDSGIRVSKQATLKQWQSALRAVNYDFKAINGSLEAMLRLDINSNNPREIAGLVRDLQAGAERFYPSCEDDYGSLSDIASKVMALGCARHGLHILGLKGLEKMTVRDLLNSASALMHTESFEEAKEKVDSINEKELESEGLLGAFRRIKSSLALMANPPRCLIIHDDENESKEFRELIQKTRKAKLVKIVDIDELRIEFSEVIFKDIQIVILHLTKTTSDNIQRLSESLLMKGFSVYLAIANPLTLGPELLLSKSTFGMNCSFQQTSAARILFERKFRYGNLNIRINESINRRWRFIARNILFNVLGFLLTAPKNSLCVEELRILKLKGGCQSIMILRQGKTTWPLTISVYPVGTITKSSLDIKQEGGYTLAVEGDALGNYRLLSQKGNEARVRELDFGSEDNWQRHLIGYYTKSDVSTPEVSGMTSLKQVFDIIGMMLHI